MAWRWLNDLDWMDSNYHRCNRSDCCWSGCILWALGNESGDQIFHGGEEMRDKKYLQFAILFIGLAILLLLAFGCKPKSCPIKFIDRTAFVTYPDGRTEIKLLCLNLSDRYVLGVFAEVTIQHMQTKTIIDCVRVNIGVNIPREVKHFSAWTDRLIFGDDVGVWTSFTYTGMR